MSSLWISVKACYSLKTFITFFFMMQTTVSPTLVGTAHFHNYGGIKQRKALKKKKKVQFLCFCWNKFWHFAPLLVLLVKRSEQGMHNSFYHPQKNPCLGKFHIRLVPFIKVSWLLNPKSLHRKIHLQDGFPTLMIMSQLSVYSSLHLM